LDKLNVKMLKIP